MEEHTARYRRARSVVGLLLLAFVLYRVDAVIDLMKKLLSILAPFVVGTLMALLINLPLQFLENRIELPPGKPHLFKIRRAACLSVSVLVVLSVFVVLLLVIVPQVVTAVESLIQALPSLIDQLEAWLSQQSANLREIMGLSSTDESSVREQFQSVYNFLIGGISYSSNVVLSAAQLVINALVGLVFAIYLLFSKERIKQQLLRVSDAYLGPRRSFQLRRVLDLLVDAFSNFIGGQLLQALLSSLLTWTVMAIFGMPYATLVSFIVFAMAFIPIFGPYLSGVIGTLLVLTQEPGKALWFLLLFFVVQQLEGSLVYPRIMSNAVDMPSIWILVAVTLGGGIMGILGMLLFIPLAAVAYRILGEETVRREALGVRRDAAEASP